MTALSTLFAACLLLLPVPGRAHDLPALPAVGDAIYKGVVGKVLDAVPMESERRVALQRTNAVLSNTFTVRSLAAWAGLANPIFLVAGVAWGLFAASNIKPNEAGPATDTTVVETEIADGRPWTEVVFLDSPRSQLQPHQQW